MPKAGNNEDLHLLKSFGYQKNSAVDSSKAAGGENDNNPLRVDTANLGSCKNEQQLKMAIGYETPKL